MIEELQEFFTQATGLVPYGDYQLEPALHVANGRSVILRAPTGSGKSEALLCAYLWAQRIYSDFPTQMIIALPMRVLVDSLAQRLQGYTQRLHNHVNGFSIRVAALHGQRPTSPLLLRDVVVATIDQVVAAYCCTPLSMPVRHGNMPAGAVASAFLAFDEVHTFDPERALQAAFLLAEHSHKMGLPIAVMSATMPDALIEAIQQRFDAQLIEAQEVPVQRKRAIRLYLDRFLSPEYIRQAWVQTDRSLLVVCNTVDRARKLYDALYQELPVRLLHARFLENDRRDAEERLQPMLGQNATERGILIATQVVEVGLDISANLLLTEVAPIDALIQRAGRVARWGDEGEIWVFNVPCPAPYEEDLDGGNLIELTKRHLLERFNGGGELNWDQEKTLVNAVLNDWFRQYLAAQQRGRVLYQLAEGAFHGSRHEVEEAVRENLSCEISIHDRPASLGRDVWHLPKVQVPVSVVRQFVKQMGLDRILDRIWHVGVDEGSHADIDQRPNVRCDPLRSTRDLVPNNLYILSSAICAYDPKRGLLLGETGKPFVPLPLAKSRRPLVDTSSRERWQEHCTNVLRVFCELFAPRYRGILERLAKWWGIDYEVFFTRCAFAIGMHDLGKLGQEWQNKIGRQPAEPPIAHSGDHAAKNLPPHATISAYALSNLFAQWERLGDVLRYAVAHHHSVRAVNVPRYKLVSEWDSEVRRLLAEWPTLAPLWQPGLVISHQKAPTTLASRLPHLNDARAWRTYAIISRLLRFSDRVATGGSEDVLFRYEDWLADV